MGDAEYGVGIKNRFAFLDGDDEEDNGNVEVIAAPAVKAAPTAKPVNKPQWTPGQQGSLKQTPLETGGARNQAPRGDNRLRDSNAQEPRRAPRNNETDNNRRRDVRPGQGGGEDRRRSNNAERGGYSNNPRQGGGNRNYNRRDGRSNGEGGHDRNQDKEKSGENGNEAENNTNAEEGVEGGEREEGEGAEDQETETKAEEKTLTLAEWKALQAPREKPVFNIRKPGEGDVSSKLGKLVLKKKEDDLADQEDEEYEADEVYYPQRAGKMKLISDVGFNTGYQQKRRGGGGRGGSGGPPRSGDGGQRREREPGNPEQPDFQSRPRGGGGPGAGPRPRGGGYRGGPRVPQAPRIDDASAFPTLG